MKIAISGALPIRAGSVSDRSDFRQRQGGVHVARSQHGPDDFLGLGAGDEQKQVTARRAALPANPNSPCSL